MLCKSDGRAIILFEGTDHQKAQVAYYLLNPMLLMESWVDKSTKHKQLTKIAVQLYSLYSTTQVFKSSTLSLFLS